jgi:hypothetical protein
MRGKTVGYIVTTLALSTLLHAATSKVDEKTGLVWQDNPQLPAELDYLAAKQYCHQLSLDGFSDWRLPTIKELASIIDLKTYRPALKNGFVMRLEERFWSDTPDAGNPRNAWVVSFSYGEIASYPRSRAYHVRCVRGKMKQP